MEQQQGHPVVAGSCTILSVISSAFALISIKEAQAIAGLIASGVAIVSGIMAIRYYHFQAKKIKKDA